MTPRLPTNARLRVEMMNGGPLDTRQPRSVTLRVEDEVSGECIVEVDFDEHQFLQLLGNCGIRVDGFVGQHLDRVGREMVVESVRVPPEVTDVIPFDRADLARERERLACLVWAKENDWTQATWDEVSATRHNFGWQITGRRWN